MNPNIIQAKILLRLHYEKKPFKFTEIKELFHDSKFYNNMTISRALKSLVKSGYVIKNGEGTRRTSYEINKSNHELKEIITKLKALPNEKDVFYTIGIKETRRLPTIDARYTFSTAPTGSRNQI